jgi:hypothetical protein
MRKTLVAAAAATILSAGAFLTSGANAMTLTTPAGMRLATEGVNVAEPVRHRCYRSRSGRLVCVAHRRVVYGGYGYGYPSYGYGYGYPSYGYGYGYPYYGYGLGLGIGYGLGSWGGGHHHVRHHHHRHHRR